jgi:5-methylcytosine-specific restriction endonuclease McrA
MDKERETPQYAEWRDKVFKRDRFMCKFCGRQGKLEAHHIKSFSDNKKLRFVAYNGATLCIDCHEKFHARYGKGCNDEKQFKEWLKEKTRKEKSHMIPIFE